MDVNIVCNNCDKNISATKIDLHEAYCLRNIRRCEKCNKPIEKQELEKHMITHAPGYKQDELKFCCFCDKEVSKDGFKDHQEECGKSQVKCCVCEQKYDSHIVECLTIHENPEYKKHLEEEQQKEREIQLQKEGKNYLKLFYQGITRTITDGDLENYDHQKLTFITYNVWFEPHNFEERHEALRQIFKEKKAHFICLQEVTVDFIVLLQKDIELLKNYYLTQSTINGYGVMIFSRRKGLFKEMYYENDTNMGRSLLYGKFKINNQDFVIGTIIAHLESLNSAPLRKRQMEKAFGELSKYENSILMGDFNFDSKQEDSLIPQNFQDIWPNLHQKSEEEFTMKKSKRFRAWRPDRICLKQQNNWKATKIERIGMDPIDKYKIKPGQEFEIITPSDHFGLYCEIEFTNTNQK